MSLKTGVEVLEWMRMSGNFGVECSKKFQTEEKYIGDHCIVTIFPVLNGFPAWIKLVSFLTISAKIMRSAGPPAKAEARKPCRHYCGEPKMSSRETCVEECRNRMDAECPRDGEDKIRDFIQERGLDPFADLNSTYPPDHYVKEEIPVQHNHVQNRMELGVGCSITLIPSSAGQDPQR